MVLDSSRRSSSHSNNSSGSRSNNVGTEQQKSLERDLPENDVEELEESTFLAGFFTWIMVIGLGRRDTLPSSSKRAERKSMRIT